MALSVWSPEAMASTVRCSVQTKSRMEQVAEPSSDRVVRYNPSPEQGAHHPHHLFVRNVHIDLNRASFRRERLHHVLIVFQPSYRMRQQFGKPTRKF